jgi:hypothetical protein
MRDLRERVPGVGVVLGFPMRYDVINGAFHKLQGVQQLAALGDNWHYVFCAYEVALFALAFFSALAKVGSLHRRLDLIGDKLKRLV